MNRYVELLERAEKLSNDALALLESDDPQAVERAEKMIADAESYRDQAARANEIVQRAEKMIGGAEPDNDPTPDGAFGSFEEFLRTVWTVKRTGNSDPRLQYFRDMPDDTKQSTMVENVGASGGFLVPTEFMPDMMSVAPEDAIVRSRATIIRMNRRQVTMPVVDQTGTTADIPHWFGGMKFFWQDEATEKTLTEAQFRQFVLTAHKLIGYTRASDELLADSAVSLADFITGPLGFRGGIMWMEDYAFLNGTGVGQPQGVIESPATITVARQQDTQFEYQDFANMFSHMLPQSRSRAVWVINVGLMDRIITLEGPSGNPSFIWSPNAAQGIPDMLLGRPVIWTEKTPGLNNKGDVLLADFQYYLIGDRQATTIESTQFDRWAYDETSWRAVHRVDGRCWLSTPITLQDGSFTVSPFVVLGQKST